MNTPASTERLSPWLEQAWLARYLERGLSETEIEWFEAYMLDKPELLAVVEADSDLRDGARLADPQPGAAAARPQSPTEGSTQARAGRARRKPPTLMAWAASLLVAVGAGWSLRPTGGPGEPLPSVVGSPTRIIFETMRGAAEQPVVHSGDVRSGFVLVEVALPPEATDVAVLVGSGRPQALTLANDGFASFLLARQSIAADGTARIAYQVDGVRQERVLDVAGVLQSAPR